MRNLKKLFFNPFALVAALCLVPEIWAQTQAYYRHHQLSSTTSLEASLVNREIGIDASARSCIVGKLANGTAFHGICKEMDTASLNGVLNVTGQLNGSSALRLSLYNQHSVPFFGSGGLVSEDASNFTFNDATNTFGTGRILASDTVRGAHLRTSGNLIVGGTGAITGALSSGAFSATTGAFSSTLGVTGVQTNADRLTFSTNASGSTASLWKSSTTGLTLEGETGSSYDFAVLNPSAQAIFRNPTGTQTAEFPGAVSMSSTLGVTGKLTGSDTIAAALGFRAGSAGATDAQLYRSGANMWTTPDSLTVAGRLAVTGTVTADSIISPKFYEEGTYTATLTGVSGSVTGTARYVRVGKHVTLYMPTLVGTSNATTCTVTGAPASIRPARQQYFPINDFGDNGAVYSGIAAMGTSGTLGFAFWQTATTFQTTFTSSGVKGPGEFVATYSLL